MTDRSPEPSEVETIWLWRCRECGWVGFSEDGHCRQFDEHPDGPRIPLESVQYVPLDAARGRSRDDTTTLALTEAHDMLITIASMQVERHGDQVRSMAATMAAALARFGAARTKEK